MKCRILQTLVLLNSLVFNSCVSDEEHNKVIEEKNSIQIENRKLKEELDEIKFGAPN